MKRFQQAQEYHIRAKGFATNGYRDDIELPEGLPIFISERMKGFKIINDPDYNLSDDQERKFCASEEGGFYHIYFEEQLFSDQETDKLIDEIVANLKTVYHKPIEWFRSA